MPLYRLNFRDGLLDTRTPPDALPKAMIDQIKTLPVGAPIIVLLHGYNYSPYRKLANPHRHILSYHPDPHSWKAISWPRHMGFGRGRQAEGLCLAVGWNAMGGLRVAYDRAELTGQSLAKIIDQIHEIAPDRSINILAHSLGARVALSVLPALNKGRISRIILLAGAEFCQTAAAALDCPAGRETEVINITSRENDIFDFMFEWHLGRARLRGFSIAVGQKGRLENWVDFQMDNPMQQNKIWQAGYKLADTGGRVCHWSTYLRGGVFPFYNAMLRHQELLHFERLRNIAITRPDYRWSKLVPRINLQNFVGNLASRP